MMKSLMIAALTLASTSAMAALSRSNVLQGALNPAFDHQDAFAEPALMWSVSDAFVAEYGTGAQADRSAALIRTSGDAKWGFWLGRNSDSPAGMAAATGYTILGQQNPFTVAYAVKGDGLTWGVSLLYSVSKQEKDATTNYKNNSMGVNLSAVGSNWRAALNQGLSGKFETTDTTGTVTNDLTMKGNTKLSGQYSMETMEVYASYAMVGGKRTDGTTTLAEADKTALFIGAESAIKGEAAAFVYGAGIQMDTLKIKDGNKTDENYLPVWMGFEGDAASWLALRGAYKQVLNLYDTKKVTPNGGDATTTSGASNSVATLGSTLKFNKIAVDLNMSTGLGAGTLNSTNLGAEAGLTYYF